MSSLRSYLFVRSQGSYLLSHNCSETNIKEYPSKEIVLVSVAPENYLDNFGNYV